MRFMKKLCRFILLPGLIITGLAPLSAGGAVLGPAVRIFVGKILTMDGNDRLVEAVAVDGRGLIVAIGTEAEVMAATRATASTPEIIRLKPGQTLLPGFIDAHLHVFGPLLEHSGLAELVGPCRPGPYHAGDPPDCSNYIRKTFALLKQRLGDAEKTLDAGAKKELQSVFVIGINLDPSRQPYAPAISSADFKNAPAEFIAKDLSKDRPVLILDQSGHFGYVNEAAFKALKELCGSGSTACTKFPPDLGGSGAELKKKKSCTDEQTQSPSCYTGLLMEPGSYGVFMPAVAKGAGIDLRLDPKKYVASVPKGVLRTLDAFRKAGLTTITSMAESVNEVDATRLLAELPQSGTRMLSIVPPEIAEKLPVKNEPILPACDPLTTPACPGLPRDLGVTGIKVMVDGSTQGCTAALQKPVKYLETSECSPPEGRPNYESWQEVYEKLKPYWHSGKWRLESHANGNHALAMVLQAYASLQRDMPGNKHTATIIHSTVGEELLWKRARELREGNYKMSPGEPPVPAVDLRFTHLIGHVAYWGAVFERQLGPEAAANIDPTAFDRKYGIPFTLHSDAPVSVPVPLWFVRQAVTRETWAYPELTSSHVLGPQHRITVGEALRAITIRAAEEKELDRWLGSIEVGKVADFVVLSANPMLFDPQVGGDPKKITDIVVVATYLGGKRTGTP